MRDHQAGSIKQFTVAVALLAAITPTVASAGSLLGALAKALAPQRPLANQDMLDRVQSDINLAPDAACKIPQPIIQRWLAQHVNDQGLMDNVADTVFHQARNQPAENGYDALLRQQREETRRRAAQTSATYRAAETGGQVPVGGPPTAPTPDYNANLTGVKAVNRIANGLDCTATAEVDALRFTVTYNLTLDPKQEDGWDSHWKVPPFSEAQALADEPYILIAYNGSSLPLAQARRQSATDLAERTAAIQRAQRQSAAQQAYRNSPAGRAQAALALRALSADYRRRGLACQNSGGTWGYRMGNHKIGEIPPGAIPDEYDRESLACYHL